MSTVMDKITTAQDQAIGFVERMQKPMVEPVGKLVNAMEERVAKLPFGDVMPTPAELVKNQFAMAEKMLTISRNFAFGLMGEAAPKAKTTK